MKIKYLFTGAFLAMLAFTGCEDPDSLVRTESESISELTINGVLTSDENTRYDAIVDEATHTVTVQVPYYISTTEPIQGDLTQMKISATLPIGAKFEPSIAGVHDLTEGFEATLIAEDGSKTVWTFKAVYVKSDQSSITKIDLTDGTRATIRIVEPEEGESEGKIIIYKTSSAIDAALKSAELTISPWSTVESPALDATTGIIDLSTLPEVTVTAQNGTDKTVYKTSMELPEILSQGVGYIACLFGFQTYTDDAHGFEEDANRTMAVVGDYLIVNNSNDYTKMLVFNRYNGKLLDVKVNTTGLAEGRTIHAITNDDAGHLVAMTYTDANNIILRAWVWNNGIESAPKSIIWADIENTQSFPIGQCRQIGHTICVKGDLTSGDAVITTIPPTLYGGVIIIKFVNGTMQFPVTVENHGQNTAGTNIGSAWYASKAVPLTATSPYRYIWDSGNFHRWVHYSVPTATTTFNEPTSHWWSGNVWGTGYIEFNGTHLLGVQNTFGLYGNATATRLYVADITSNPGTSSMASGFIFDSREGNSAGTAEIPGSGYGPTGMISKYSYESGKTVLSSNCTETGDVVFGRSDDGNAVQVYMLTTNWGLIAYEITRFDL